MKSKKTGVFLLLPLAALAALGVYSFSSSPPHQAQGVIMHIHARLEVFVDGQPLIIPANIGIDSSVWKDHSLERYGMPMPGMPEMPYMSPLHTHDTSGTIHIESTINRNHTVGEFFDVWGVPFNETCIFDKCSQSGSIIMLVNGIRSYEFENQLLGDGEIIQIEFRGG